MGEVVHMARTKQARKYTGGNAPREQLATRLGRTRRETTRAWLAEQGFAEGDLRSEITINQRMKCPMAWASQNGELDVCKWLHENGAAADITKANNKGVTPMWTACQNGHLSVCKWLFGVGAAADITKADNNGFTPTELTRPPRTGESSPSGAAGAGIF